MADVVIRSVRIFKVENSGDLSDKCNKDVELTIQYDPQGINLKIDSGKFMCTVQCAHSKIHTKKIVYQDAVAAAANMQLFFSRGGDTLHLNSRVINHNTYISQTMAPIMVASNFPSHRSPIPHAWATEHRSLTLTTKIYALNSKAPQTPRNYVKSSRTSSDSIRNRYFHSAPKNRLPHNIFNFMAT